MEIRVSFLDKLVELVAEWLRKDRRKTLPQREVVLGRFTKDERLVLDICAEILLGEEAPPKVELFLRRLRLGRPYCPRCLRPLDEWRAGWMADFGQIGYRCPRCGTEIEGDEADLAADVDGAVRRDFPDYWRRYQTEIRRLTRGKPHKYKLPG